MEAVRLADTYDEFIAACDEALKMGSGTAWLKEADTALNQMSWDKTFQAMSRLINARISASTKSTQHVSSPAIWGGERPKKYAYLVVGAGFAGSVIDRKSTRLNSSPSCAPRMLSS